MNEPARTPPGWPMRSALLTLAGAIVGLAVNLLIPVGTGLHSETTNSIERLALATLLVVAGMAFAFVVERTRLLWSAAFAAAAGLVVASVVYWNGPMGRPWDSDIWRMTSAALTVAIAAPLFQAWCDGRRPGASRFEIGYSATHDHAWANVMLWMAAWLFVAIVFLLGWLLAELFNLIGIDVVLRLLRKDRVIMMLAGAAFGGAVGLLRDRASVLGTLQRVVMAILSVLAPVLAAGLLLFLLALPFTGLVPLWEATKSTTPILLVCVIGALVLVNAVIGNRPEDESRLAVLRWSAAVLALVMLPLAIIAAISTSRRIDQYGLTPDRLWAIVFMGFAAAYGVAYLLAVPRGRRDWPAMVRVANLRLAMALCAVALLLSTPLINIGAIATRDQLTRLDDGRTPPDKFDWVALRFDFGPAGAAAVKRLQTHGATPAIRSAAVTADKLTNRWERDSRSINLGVGSDVAARWAVLPQPVVLPAGLARALADYEGCTMSFPCAVIFQPGSKMAAIAVRETNGEIGALSLYQQTSNVDSQWLMYQESASPDAAAKARTARLAAALTAHQVEIRTVERRQVFVGGEPLGDTFK
jgi:hypothetical protein